MSKEAEFQLLAMSSAMMIEAAAGAYTTAMGADYLENRVAIMEDVKANIDATVSDAQRVIRLINKAGIFERDPKFAGQIMASALAGLGVKAAAKVVGEPPEDEEKPAPEAIH